MLIPVYLGGMGRGYIVSKGTPGTVRAPTSHGPTYPGYHGTVASPTYVHTTGPW